MYVQSCCFFVVFLPFSLLSPSILLKLPINFTRSWIVRGRLAGHLGEGNKRNQRGGKEENLYCFLLLIPLAYPTHFPCYLGVAQIEGCNRHVIRANVNKPRDAIVCHVMCHDTAFILVTYGPKITHGKLKLAIENKRIEKTR